METTTRNTTQRTIRIRDKSFKRIKKLSETYRGLSMVEVIDMLVEGWDNLTSDEQTSILTRPMRKGT